MLRSVRSWLCLWLRLDVTQTLRSNTGLRSEQELPAMTTACPPTDFWERLPSQALLSAISDSRYQPRPDLPMAVPTPAERRYGNLHIGLNPHSRA
jgi:hypothetical protein